MKILTFVKELLQLPDSDLSQRLSNTSSQSKDNILIMQRIARLRGVLACFPVCLTNTPILIQQMERYIMSCLPDGAGRGSNLGPKIGSLLGNRSGNTRSLHLSLGVHNHTSVIYPLSPLTTSYPRSRGTRRSFFSSSFSV